MSTTQDLMGLGMPPALAARLGNTPASLNGVGTAQTGAAVISSPVELVTPTGGNTAFVLNSGFSTGRPIYIWNQSASQTALIYGPTGSTINGGSVNASISVPPLSGVTMQLVNGSGTAAQNFGANFGGTVANTLTPSLTSETITGQSASVTPLTITAGTLNTAAVAGGVEFDGTAFYATSVAGARQQIDAEQFCILAADNSAVGRGNTAFAVFNSTTNGAVTLAAGKTYAFEANYILTNVNTTSHTWSTLFAGTATLTSIAYSIFGVTSTASTPASGGLSGWANVATAIVATAAQTSATENAVIQLYGVVTINAGGTFIPQLQASANLSTGAQVVKAGSYFRIYEMASSATVGNWS